MPSTALRSMSRPRFKARRFWMPALLAALMTLAMASPALASHFRFGHISWTREPGTRAVTFTVTTGWRTLIGDEPVDLFFGDGQSVRVLHAGELIATGPDYQVQRFQVTHTYATDGPYTAFHQEGNRISLAVNSNDSLYRLETTVDMRDGNLGSPASSLPVIVQMTPEELNEVQLPALDADGDPLSFRMATTAESQIRTLAGSQSGHPISVSPTGLLSWFTHETLPGDLYAVQVMIEGTHAGRVVKTPIDFLVQIVSEATNFAPECSFDNIPNNAAPVGHGFTIIVAEGQHLSLSVTGTDPEGQPLRINHFGLPTGATLAPPNGTTSASPLTAILDWTPAAGDRGEVYAISITYTDPAGLQEICSFAVRVADNEPPLVICRNVLLELDFLGHATLTAAQLDGGSYDPEGGPLTLTIGQSEFDCDDLGLQTVTLTALDQAGLIGEGEGEIEVVDLLAPSIACPANATATAEPGADEAAVDPGLAIGQDNCGETTITAVRNDGRALSDPYAVGTTWITWRATDSSGNYEECVQTVTVVSGASPTPTPTAEPTATPTPSLTTSLTPSKTASVSPTESKTASLTPTASVTQTTSLTPSAQPSATATPAPACPECDGTEIVVNAPISIDAANLAATAGDLAPYASFNGTTILIDLGAKSLRVTSAGNISVPAGSALQPAAFHVSGNHGTPNLTIKSSCTLLIETSTRGMVETKYRSLTGVIETQARGLKAGDITLDFGGGVTINGGVQSFQENLPDAQASLSGAITIASACGDVAIGPAAWILTWGQNPGSGAINILQCGTGDIAIDGLVMNRTNHTLGDNDPPIIQVAAFGGDVTINGGNLVLNEFSYGGGLYDLTSGLLTTSIDASDVGRVYVQAQGDISVARNVQALTLNRTNYAAIATEVTSSTTKGGQIEVRSLGGSVTLRDRAIEANGKADNSAASAQVFAAGDITIQSPTVAGDANHSPTITTEAAAVNGVAKGGTNRLQSCGGSIEVQANAKLHAIGSSQAGNNYLTAASGSVTVISTAVVNPASQTEAGCSSVAPMFEDCGEFIAGYQTPAPTPTASPTPGATATPSASPTPAESSTPTFTVSPTPTLTETPSPTASESLIPTTAPPTQSPSLSPTPSKSPSPSLTASPEGTASRTPTPSLTPSFTPSPTPSVSPTASPSASPTSSNATPIAGLRGNGLDLDGANDRLRIKYPPWNNPDTVFVEMWVRPDTAGPMMLFFRGQSGGTAPTGGQDHWIRINAQGKFEITFDDIVQGPRTVTGTTTVVPGQWYHVAAGGGSSIPARLYVNGLEEGTRRQIIAGDSGRDSLWIGPQTSSLEARLNGRIDDVRVWNVRRTGEEVRGNMHRRLRGDEPGLAGYWPLDEGTGNVAYDDAATQRNAFLLDGPAWFNSDAPVLDEEAHVAASEETAVTIQLAGLDADGDPLSARITTLPISGTLFQTADGIAPGAEITFAGEAVSDPLKRVIYVPGPGAGVPFDQFGFMVNDGEADSGEALVTIDIAPNTPPVAGLAGSALVFDGVNDAIDVADPLDPIEWTVEAWVNPADTTNVNLINRRNWSIGLNGFGEFNYLVGAQSEQSLNLAAAGAWRHVASTSSLSGERHLYVNGIEEGAPFDFPLGSDPAALRYSIGLNIGTGPQRWNGRMDEIRVWSVAKTQAQVVAGMHQSLSGSEANLLGYWPLDEGTGNIARNGSARGYNGLIAGGAAWSASDAPLLDSSAIATTAAGQAKTIQFRAFDADGDPTTLRITGLPVNGALHQTANGTTPLAQITAIGAQVDDPQGRVIYLPGHGAGVPFDEFRFVANDGQDDSAEATVAINIPVNRPPVAGFNGRALSFDGVGATDYVQILDALDPSAYTIEAWVKPDDSVNRSIFQRSSNGFASGQQFQIRTNSLGRFEGFLRDPADKTVTHLNSLVPGQWHHVAGVGTSGGEMRLYVNGVEEATPQSVGTISINGDRYRIGANTGTGSIDFKGIIDEARVWNFARSADAIRSTMNSRLAGTEPGLLGYWPMEEPSGTTVLDGSARGINGAIVGTLARVVSDAPVPNSASTFTVQELQDLTIQLRAVDPEGGPVSAIITSLPAAGSLYQVLSDGSRGLQITAAGTTVSDPQLRVIYNSGPGFGSPFATFQFKASDGQADSNIATATINVTAAPTPTPSPSPSPSLTPSLTVSLTASLTPSPSPTISLTPSLTASQAPTLTPTPANHDPIITSTGPRSQKVNSPLRYDVEATDEDGDVLAYSLVSYPTGMAINLSTGLITWTPTTEGTFAVQVLVEDGRGGQATQWFNVLVSKTGNSAPVITSTADTTADATLPYLYDVEADDADGFPLFYSLTDAPAGMQINIGTGEIEWTPSMAQIGPHPVTVKVEDPIGASDSQSFMINVVDPGDIIPPVVTINYAPFEPNPGQAIALTLHATDNVGVTAVDLDINGQNVPLTQFNATTWTGTYTAAAPVVLTAIAAATDAAGNEGSDIQLIYVQAPGDNACPTVEITYPEIDAEITEPTDLIGQADDPNIASYTLEYRLTGTTEWTTFHTSGTAVLAGGRLGTFDPTLLLNGIYDVRLTAMDVNGTGCYIETRYRVAGDMKLGHFSFTVEDLAIPVSGIPVTVNRTYDTRNKAKGDFGVGWTLDFQDIRLQENVVPGSNWDQSFGGLNQVCGDPVGEHYVTITLPDGRTEEFDAILDPPCVIEQAGSGITTAKFQARPGTFSKLESLIDNAVFISGSELTTFTGHTWNPNHYKLTTRDGYIYFIRQLAGGKTAIEKVQDPNGNWIEFSSAGVLHSTGKSIAFTRDSEGRITKITDPMGGELKYFYDAAGDLVEVRDQEDRFTKYTYNGGHHMIDIVDGRNVRVSRNVYDDDGRLVSSIDANGNAVEFGHFLSDNMETITDREGNQTVLIYDARGRVIQEIAPNGMETRREYTSGRRTMTKETVAWGTPLQHEVNFEYNATDDLTRKHEINVIPQPSGPPQTQLIEERWQYDAKGNQTQHTDPRGFVTDMVYDTRNHLTQEIKRGDPGITADDIVTAHAYDSAGNRTQTINGEGNVAKGTYNALGYMTQTRVILGLNDTTSAETDDIVTTMDFDANGRLTSVVGSCNCSGERRIDYDQTGFPIRVTAFGDPSASQDDQTVEHGYNPAGYLSHVRNPNGFMITMENDLAGRLMVFRQPAVPDPAISGSLARPANMLTRDREGRILSTTDPAGRTSRTEYDEIGNKAKHINPSGAVSEIEYDLRSRMIREFDERSVAAGKTWFTAHVYDSLGREVATVDALGNPTRIEHDASGNVIATIDALGRRTEFAFDAFGRMTETKLPPASAGEPNVFRRTEYDKLDRKIRELDENNHATSFGYDEAGRMTSVTDARNSTWTFGYNDDGHLTSQTDPLSRTTLWGYDFHGRKKSRTLPLGQTERFHYDLNGNLVLHEKFDGKLLAYTYDALDRQVARDYPNDLDETLEFSLASELVRAVDGHGATAYRYDANGRLARVDHPTDESILYAYDDAGNLILTEVRIASTDAIVSSTRYTHDRLNRLETVLASPGLWTYHHNEVGLRTAQVNPNNTRTDYQHDGRNRLARLTTINSAAPFTINDFEYEMDAKGNRTRITDHADGSVTDYGYDEVDRLTSEIRSNAPTAYSRAFTLDAVGNRLAQATTGFLNDNQTYSYDANDRLLAMIDGARTVSYGYDANGNQTSEGDSWTGNSRTFNWNDRDRLAGVSDNGLAVASYAYDHAANRIARTIGGVSTRFLIDQANLTGFSQVRSETGPSGIELVSYVLGDDLLAQRRSDIFPSFDPTSYYHHDGIGSVRSLTGTVGNVTHAYTYEAFGELLSGGENPSNIPLNAYRFTGEHYDMESGYYFLRARYLNPGNGSFLSRDALRIAPLGRIPLNGYGYANANPISNVDLDGLYATMVDISAANALRSILMEMELNAGFNIMDVAQNGSEGGTERFARSLAIGAGIRVAFKLIGGAISQLFPRSTPRGIILGRWAQAVDIVSEGTKHISNDVRVHGSRALTVFGFVEETTDLDIMVRVTPDEFREWIRKAFGTPNPGSAKSRSRFFSIADGRIFAREAGLAQVRDAAQDALGKKVQISIVEIGGPFDSGVKIPINGYNP